MVVVAVRLLVLVVCLFGCCVFDAVRVFAGGFVALIHFRFAWLLGWGGLDLL